MNSGRGRLVAAVLVVLASGACSRRPDGAPGSPPPPSAVVLHDAAIAESMDARAPATPMSYLGAEWLERGTREKEEEPERVLDALNLRPGNVVADLGAGTGYFSLRIARRVAPGGRVLATEIQKEMLERLRANAAREKVENVELVLATEDDARLPENTIDLVLMVDVYHELAHPKVTLQQVRRALHDGGRMVLVEYRGEDPSVPIKPEHKMTLADVRGEIEPNGFRFLESLEFLKTQRVILFTPTARR